MLASLISMQEPSVIPELTLPVTAAAARVALKVARTCVLSISAALLHTASASGKDNRKLAAARLTSLSVCLQYIVCHTELGVCPNILRKKSRLGFYHTLFSFSPEVQSCFGTPAMSIALKQLS